jgi:hypothetical protein
LDLKGRSVSDQLADNDPGSPVHMDVYRCVVTLIGEDAYRLWLKEQYAFGNDEINRHLKDLKQK